MADAVAQPPHYTSHPSGVEMTAIAEHYGFCLGNVIKYVWRANLKGEPLEDLRKAAWYLDREIARREAAEPTPVEDVFTAICGRSIPSGLRDFPYACILPARHTGGHAAFEDQLEAFTTPGYAASDEQFVRGEE